MAWKFHNFLLFGVGKYPGRIIDSDMHDVGRFLNRILGLVPEIQNRSVIFLALEQFLITVGVILTILCK